MILCNYFSYKSFYYFLKDTSCLDLSKFKSTFLGEDVVYDEEYFWRLFDSYHIGTKDIVIVKTNKGAFVYHEIEDNEYVKSFLEQNSKVAPCGVFGSYRTSDVYLAGIAENGKVKRFLYNEDGEEPVIEGERTEFEIQNNFNPVKDDFESQIKFFNEENIYDYAKWFVGFDIDTEDLMIDDILFYDYAIHDNKLPSSIPQKIKEKFNSSKITELGIIFSYNKKTGEFVISCDNAESKQKRNNIFCEITSLTEKQIFKESFNRCINAILSSNLNSENPTVNSMDSYYYKVNDKDCNMAFVILDIERKFMTSVLLFQKSGKRIKQSFFNTLRFGKIFYDLNENVIDDIYNKLVKILNK